MKLPFPRFTTSKQFRLLALAAALHLAIALTIFLLGRFGVSNYYLNDQGFSRALGDDSITYSQQVKTLVDTLPQRGFVGWISAPFPFHLKLYSLSYAVLSPLTGFTTFSAEPLNLLCYLTIVCFVYKIGKEVFDEKVGIVAAGIVALWPTFLVHTTQLLKDPMSVAALLPLVYLNVLFLKRECNWWAALLCGVGAGLLALFGFFVRVDTWEVTLAAMLIAGALVVLNQVIRRKFQPWNLAGVATMLLVALAFANALSDVRRIYFPAGEPGVSVSPPVTALRTPPPESLLSRIDRKRASFSIDYAGAGSNIDADVRFDSMAALVRYVPRAMIVGMFAPFPDMWLSQGTSTGRIGRLLSGFETLLMYVLIALGLFKLWRERTNLTAWFLFLVSIMGAIALGLVVANIGALYRLRYGYWMLLVILGAGGLVHLIRERSMRRTATD